MSKNKPPATIVVATKKATPSWGDVKAKKAISDYKKAIGPPEALAEWMVYFCEQVAGFSSDSMGDLLAQHGIDGKARC